MSWFGGVMNGNNTAMELQIEFASAGTTQSLIRGKNGGGSGDYIYIDWGDGSAIERFSDVEYDSSTYERADHLYGGTGPYRIRTWQQNFDRNDPSNNWSWANLDTTIFDYDWNGIANNGKAKIISFGLIMLNYPDGNALTSEGMVFGQRRNNQQPVGWDHMYCQNYPIVSNSGTRLLQNFFRTNSNKGLWKDPYGNNKKLYWFNNADMSPAGVFSFSFYFQDQMNADCSSWNMSDVTNIQSLFRSCSVFDNDGNDDIGNWDTSGVGSFSQTFRSATVFNRDITDWSFASCNTTQRMLQDASAFDQDISKWTTNDGGLSTSSPGPLTFMLDNSGLSVENYSRWLIGLANWAYDNSYTTAESLGATGLEYNNTTYSGIGSGQYTDAVTARAYLVTTLGWTISGDALA